MASNIKFKRSAVQNRVPTTAQLELGELALNTYDGKLYTEINTGSASVVEIGSKLSSLVVDGDNGGGNGDVVFHGATAGRDLTWDASINRLHIADNADLAFGDGNDLIINHTGNHSFIQDAGQGHLILLSNSLYLQNTSGTETYFKAINNNQVDLYHNNAIRVTTTADGADISGTGSLKLPVGTTAQRNGSPTAGDMRYNSTTGSFEGYTNGWGELGGAGIGIGSTSVNPGSGVVGDLVGVGYTTINFVGAGLSVTGYGTTIVVDIGNAVSRKYGRKIHSYTATANQTTFTGLSYTDGASQVSVYLNGAKLSAAAYTATSGNTVVLGDGASVGDEVEILVIDSGVDITRTVHSYTATAGQTAFTGLGYERGENLDVYLNGIRLAQSDYTANNGTSLTLASGASVGDLLEIVDMGPAAQWESGFGEDNDDIFRFNGGVGIGTTNPTDKLNIVGNAEVLGIVTARDGVHITADNKYFKMGAGNDISIVHTGGESVIANATGHLTHRSDVHKWENYNASSEYARIDSSGRVLIGATSTRSVNAHAPRLQVSGTDYSTSTVSLVNNAADATGAYLFFTKQRSGSAGGSTAVAQDDIIGDIRFTAGDGTDVETGAARITVVAESNASSNSVPSYMRFSTTSTTTPVERLRITSSGNIGINTTNPQDLLHIGGTSTGLRFTANQIKFDRDSAASYIDQYGTGSIVFRTTPSGSQLERLTITSDGKMGLGTNNPRHKLQVAGDVVLTHQTGNTITNGLFLDPGDTGAGNRPDIVLKGAGTSALSVKAFQVYYDNGGTESFNIDYEGNVFSGKSITVAEKLIHHGDTDTFIEFDTNTVKLQTGGTARVTVTDATTTVSNNLTVTGNLQVDGTQTTVNSTTMTVDDKNIVLGSGAANDAAADGGGITLESGDGNKTWNWVDATDAWTSSEHIALASGKKVYLTDTNTALSEGQINTLRITTDSGYVDIGPKNTSWCHFHTDRASFYFAQNASFNGAVSPYGDSTHNIGSNTNRWANIYGDTLHGDGANVTNVNATTLDSIDSASFLRSDADDTATGNLTVRDILMSSNYHLQRSNHHSGHLEGSYNNVGANDSRSNPIYTIGSSYNPTDSALSDMYGIGYTHTNASFISFTGASGWGMYVAADGDARIYLGGSNGVISSTGQHYVGSNVVWNAGNDGSGSGLDADTLDGVQGASYLRSDANDTCNGILSIAANKAVDFITGNWTGDTSGGTGKIQAHDSALYICGGDNGIRFREHGTDRWYIDGSGHFRPHSDSTYEIGSNSYRVAAVYTDRVSTANEATRDKLRVWNSATYTMGMDNGYTFGGLNNDYAMTFQMNSDADRGFWWGDLDHSDAQGAMSLTTQGKLTVAHSMRLGYGESDTTIPGSSYKLDVSGDVKLGGNIVVGTGNASYITMVDGDHGNRQIHCNSNYIGFLNSSGNWACYAHDGGQWDCRSGLNVEGTTTTQHIQLDAGYRLRRSDHHTGHLEGSYNNVGANSAKSNPIYTIGSSYNPTDAALSNMYGIGYTKGSSTSFLTGLPGQANSWGMYVAANGDARVFLDGTLGHINAAGHLYCDRVYVDKQTSRYLTDVSGNYGSIQINGGGNGNWEGFSIDGRCVFMHDGGTSAGIYDDVNNLWMFHGTLGGDTTMRCNGTTRVTAHSSGATIAGSLTVNSRTTTEELKVAEGNNGFMLSSNGQFMTHSIGHTADHDEGIFWHTGNAYGIYRTAGSWNNNYQQLKLSWSTGILIDGGSSYGLSGVRFQCHALPHVNNQYDLGTANNRWRVIYTNDLELSNEAQKDEGGNDVDGTWGNYTIQEGEEDLFLINNRSGKKYKFNLTEVS